MKVYYLINYTDQFKRKAEWKINISLQMTLENICDYEHIH